MTDPSAFRERFRSAKTSSRLRWLARNLEIIRDQLDDGAEADSFEARLDETSWMIGWMSAEEDEDVRDELEELTRLLDEWQFEREAIISVAVARNEARVRADTWADRLTWVAGLFEATR